MESESAYSLGRDVPVVKKHYDFHLFLLLSTVCLLTIILFFGFFDVDLKERFNQFSFKSKSIGSDGVTGATEKIVDTQLREDGGVKTYQEAKSVFILVSSDYLIYSREKTRLLMESIRAQAKANFPEEFKNRDFIIPCFDIACTLRTPEVQVTELIGSISNVILKPDSGQNLNLAVNKLKILAYIGELNVEEQINYYNDAYSTVRDLYLASTESSTFRTNIQSFRNLISSKFPNQYSLYEDVNFYDF